MGDPAQPSRDRLGRPFATEGDARAGGSEQGTALGFPADGYADEEGGRSCSSGVLVGIGVAGFVDETVFHQLLHWHHFYDRATPTAGLVSDGLFHAASWICIVGGLFLYADIRRRRTYWHLRFLAGLCIGLGGFQLYDGTIQHKLLRLHQIRYHVSIVPYDLAWNILAAIVLVLGLALYRRSARHAPPLRPSASQS